MGAAGASGSGKAARLEAEPVAPPEPCPEAIGADGWRTLAELQLLRDAGRESAAERQLELPEGFGG